MNLDQRAIEERLARRLSIIMRQETDDAFRTKAWGGVPWAPTRWVNLRGSLMLRPGAALRKSLTFRAEGNRVIVSSSLIYAQIHNEGGVVTVPVTDKMRRYFFAMHRETGVPRYLAMALSRKQQYRIVIPRRQFVGITPETRKRLEASP